MLSLATHEPHFRVLREDVFHQEGSRTACRICGQEGHYAAQCTGTKAEIKKTPTEKKPFIFLDVAILREYLEAELNVPNVPFPFNFEQAIDDWVLLIFFVGNDFLPHLPSLEIREGAIDTLLKIWRTELPRMGGYITNHGQYPVSRCQILKFGPVLPHAAYHISPIYYRINLCVEDPFQVAGSLVAGTHLGLTIALSTTSSAVPTMTHPRSARTCTLGFVY